MMVRTPAMIERVYVRREVIVIAQRMLRCGKSQRDRNERSFEIRLVGRG